MDQIRSILTLVLAVFGTCGAWAETDSNAPENTAHEYLQITVEQVESARDIVGPAPSNRVGFFVPISPVSADGDEGWSSHGPVKRWKTRISADGAQALQVRLDDLVLPAGWMLSFLDESFGLVDEMDPQEASRAGVVAWSPLIVGEKMTVVLEGPSDAVETPRLLIREVGYIETGIGDTSRGGAFNCQKSVSCFDTVDPTARKAVGRLTYSSTDGVYLAGCVLLEDSILEDRLAYVYTVGALGDLGVFHSSIKIHWLNYRATCNSQPPGLNQLPQSQGASVLATSADQDYTILRLWDPLPEVMAPVFANWGEGTPGGDLVALHFPMGADMRYGIGSIEAREDVCEQYPDDDFFFHDFVLGTYQPGSEGGGVFDEDWNLVGLVSGYCSDGGEEPGCHNHNRVNVVSSRIASAYTDLSYWLNNPVFIDDKYEPNNSQPEAVRIAEGTYDLALLHDSYDWFEFTPSCSGTLNITMHYAEVFMGPSLKIVDESGFTVVPNTLLNNGHDGISTTVVANQKYYVRVFLQNGDGGPYELTLELDDTDLTRNVFATLPPFPENPDITDDGFVWSSAMHDGTLFVGAAFSELEGFRAGAVFVYERVADGSWCLSQTLLPDPGSVGTEFGMSLAVSEDGILFVGAPHGSSAPRPGTAFVYERSGGSWHRVQTIAPSNGRNGDGFGTAVAVDGAYAIIGAPGDDLLGSGSGAAYIYGTFGSPDGSWLQQSRIEAVDMGETPALGRGVAISGTTAFATTPRADAGGASIVAVIERQVNFTWAVEQMLQFDGLGGTVFDLENVLVVGEQLWVGSDGSVVIFERFEGQWWQVERIFAPHFGDEFGKAMCGVGDIVAVSQPDNVIVYQFKAVSFGIPELISEIRPVNPFISGMGWSIATDDEALIIDGHYATAWSDDCNGDGIPDHCQLASGELADTNINGIPDVCEGADCLADLAPPTGVLDFFDVSVFLSLFSEGDSQADFAEPFCSFDFFDIALFLNSFSAGCP